MVFSMIFYASNLGFYRSCRGETLFFYKIEFCEASKTKHKKSSKNHSKIPPRTLPRPPKIDQKRKNKSKLTTKAKK